MKFIFTSIALFCCFGLQKLQAQTPTVLMPNATLGSPTHFASDGNVAYYLTRSNAFPAVISLYTIVGNSTTPVFVKDILREDTASITSMSANDFHGFQTDYNERIDYFAVVNGKMLLTYTVKPNQFSFNITGYRLMVSDGTAAGTTLALVENLTTPVFFNGNLGGLQLFKTGNIAYFTYVEAVGSTGLRFDGKIYKTDGTIAGTNLLFTTPTNESLLAQAFKFIVKNGWAYFSTYTVTGASLNTIGSWKFYRTNGNPPELITTETPLSNLSYFNVSSTHILVPYAFQASIVGLPGTATSIGFKKMALNAGFPVVGNYAINPYTPSTGNGAKDGYDFPCAEVDGTFYIAGFKDYNKCLYKVENNNTITSWNFPINAGFNTGAPIGTLTFKRAGNRLYMDHYYSAHAYSTKLPITPVNARISSLYYLTGGDPILVDSTTALQGAINPLEATTCGNIVTNNSRFLVIGSTSVYQDKLWKTDGTKANTGIVPNLYNCTANSFSVYDINPKTFATHDSKIYFSGWTGCGVNDAKPALYSWNICGTLPVTWISFDGKLIDKKVNLNWKTANEIDNLGFDVERSTDGTTFTKIGFVAATNQSTSSYNYNDEFSGKTTYYRLKQVDKNGKYEYSIVVVIQATKSELNIYPSPASSFFSIGNKNNTIKEVKLIDANGKIVKVWNKYQPTYNLNGVNNGLYSVIITTPNELVTKKIMVAR